MAKDTITLFAYPSDLIKETVETAISKAKEADKPVTVICSEAIIFEVSADADPTQIIEEHRRNFINDNPKKLDPDRICQRWTSRNDGSEPVLHIF